MIDLEKKTKIKEATAHYLKSEGFEVEANLEGYPKPAEIGWPGHKTTIIPDLTGAVDGNMFVFKLSTTELAKKTVEIDNWKLLSAYAKQKGGSLNLVTMASQEMAIRNIALKAKLSPGVLTIMEG